MNISCSQATQDPTLCRHVKSNEIIIFIIITEMFYSMIYDVILMIELTSDFSLLTNEEVGENFSNKTWKIWKIMELKGEGAFGPPFVN